MKDQMQGLKLIDPVMLLISDSNMANQSTLLGKGRSFLTPKNEHKLTLIQKSEYMSPQNGKSRVYPDPMDDQGSGTNFSLRKQQLQNDENNPQQDEDDPMLIQVLRKSQPEHHEARVQPEPPNHT
jgi:hypothetical protein